MKVDISNIYSLIKHEVLNTELLLRKVNLIRPVSNRTLQYQNASFMPLLIYNFIKDSSNKSVAFALTVNDKRIRINISDFPVQGKNKPGYLVDCLEYAMAAVSTIAKLSDVTAVKELTINILLTPFKKTVKGGEPLTPENVNSGYCVTANNQKEIVVFRREEWFKVLLHELLHAYDVGPSKADEDSFAEYMIRTRGMYNVSLDEGYIEFLARTLNCLFVAIHNDNVRRTLERERDYGKEQAVFVTRLALRPDADTLLSKTNNFSYYVLAYLLFKNVDEALSHLNGTISFKSSLMPYLENKVNAWIGRFQAYKSLNRRSKSMRMTLSRAIE